MCFAWKIASRAGAVDNYDFSKLFTDEYVVNGGEGAKPTTLTYTFQMRLHYRFKTMHLAVKESSSALLTDGGLAQGDFPEYD